MTQLILINIEVVMLWINVRSILKNYTIFWIRYHITRCLMNYLLSCIYITIIAELNGLETPDLLRHPTSTNVLSNEDSPSDSKVEMLHQLHMRAFKAYTKQQV
jgi:hypothetical protein